MRADEGTFREFPMNHGKYMKALSTALVIAGFSAVALAQDMPPTQDQQPTTAPQQSTMSDAASSQAAFAQLDANHDGSIDKIEAAADAGLGAAFDSVDADQNGRLDQAEFDKYAQGSQQGTEDGTHSDDGGRTPVPGSH